MQQMAVSQTLLGWGGGQVDVQCHEHWKLDPAKKLVL